MSLLSGELMLNALAARLDSKCLGPRARARIAVRGFYFSAALREPVIVVAARLCSRRETRLAPNAFKENRAQSGCFL